MNHKTNATSNNAERAETRSFDTALKGALTIGRLDRNPYRAVSEQMQTDEAIITNERIRHIKSRHPGVYEKYSRYMPDMVEHPKYILENKPNTALLLGQYGEDDEQVLLLLVLRLSVAGDYPGYKNSVITFLRISKKRWERYRMCKVFLGK